MVLLWNRTPTVEASTPTLPKSDVVFVIRESTVHKIFQMIGDIGATGEFQSNVVGKGTYSWKLIDPRVEFQNDVAKFRSRVTVQVKIRVPVLGLRVIDYDTHAFGAVSIEYLSKEDVCRMTIKNASFDMYIPLNGNKLPLRSVDVSKWIEGPIVFPVNLKQSLDGPCAIQKMELGKRLIQFKAIPENCYLQIGVGAVELFCNIKFIKIRK